MLVENTYGNENTDIRKHFAYIKRRFGRNGIGILFFLFLSPLLLLFLFFFSFNFFSTGSDRFEVLRRALSLDIDDIKKLCLQLRLNAAELLTTVHMVLDDEAMLGYQPSAKKKKLCDARGNYINL